MCKISTWNISNSSSMHSSFLHFRFFFFSMFIHLLFFLFHFFCLFLLFSCTFVLLFFFPLFILCAHPEKFFTFFLSFSLSNIAFVSQLHFKFFFSSLFFMLFCLIHLLFSAVVALQIFVFVFKKILLFSL